MPESSKLMGVNPRGELVPLRLDDKGRLELVQVQSGDEDAPEVALVTVPSLTIGSLPAVNPTMPTILYEGLLSASDATLYTAAANWRAIEIYLVNVDTVVRTATLYRGNAGSDANTILKAKRIEVEGREPVFLPSLISGAKINGLCDSANKVKVEIWGVSA